MLFTVNEKKKLEDFDAVLALGSAVSSLSIKGTNETELPAGLERLPLTMLQINGGGYESLPASLGSISTLEWLHVEGCTKLASIPASSSSRSTRR